MLRIESEWKKFRSAKNELTNDIQIHVKRECLTFDEEKPKQN